MIGSNETQKYKQIEIHQPLVEKQCIFTLNGIITFK